MPGRNDPCPCGSGLKFKKCCIHLKSVARRDEPSRVVFGRSGDGSLSFDSIISAEYGEDLQLLPIAKKKDLIRDAIAYLEQDSLQSIETTFDAASNICIRVVFRDARRITSIDKYEDESDYDQDYDDDYDDDYRRYAYDKDELEVFLSETSPNGPIKIEVFRNHKSVETAHNSLQVNAVLVLTWLSIGKSIERKKLPQHVRDFHKEFNDLPRLKKLLEPQRIRFYEELKHISLISISLSLEPLLADGRLLSNLDSRFRLPDQLPNAILINQKTNKADYFVNNSKLDCRRWNLPDCFLDQSEPKQKSGWQNNSHLRRLTDSINYYFSDGVVVDAGQILNTKYSRLLPPDLLPGEIALPQAEQLWKQKFKPLELGPIKSSAEILSEVSLISQERGSIYFRDAEAEKISKLMNDLMVRLARRSNGGEINIDLKWLDSSSKACLRLSQLEFAGPNLFEWQPKYFARTLKSYPNFAVTAGQFNLQKLDSAHGQMIPLKNGFLSLESRWLRIQDVSKDLQSWNDLRYSPYEELDFSERESVQTEFSTWPELKVKLTAEGTRSFVALRKKLQDNVSYRLYSEKITNKSIPIANRKKMVSANLSTEPVERSIKTKAELHLDSDGRFFLVRRLLPPKDRQLNFEKFSDSNDEIDGNLKGALEKKPENKPENKLENKLEGVADQANNQTTDSISFDYPFLNGFSFSSLKLLKILGLGIPGHFDCEAKVLASRSSPKRDFELKLLKHLGVLNLLVFESLSVRFDGVLSDGTIVKKVTDILPLLENKILALIGDPLSAPLQERCSKQVYSKLKSFMADLNSLIKSDFEKNDLRQNLLLPEGEFSVSRLLEDELRLIYAVLSHAATSSNGEIFSKARLSFLNKIFPYDEHRINECNILNSRERISIEDRPKDWVSFQLPYVRSGGAGLLAILAAFRPLLKADFEFYLKGQRIQELEPSEFRTELTLAENLLEIPSEQNEVGSEIGSEIDRRASGKNTGPINWFELNPKFFLYGKEIPSHQAGRLLKDGIIEHGGRFYLVPASRLPSLKRLSNFWERLQSGKKAGSGFSLGQQVYQVPKSQILEMLALRSSGIPVIGGARWQQVCDFYDQLDSEKAPLLLPQTIHAELKPYQKIGVQWLYELYRLGLGAILADDMGLGKTLQTLAFLEKLRDEKCMGSVLIVVPTSLTYNWLSEKEKFTPKLLMQVFSAKAKDETLSFLNTNPNSVLLTTYGMMHEHKEFFQQVNWNIIIFDEAQNLKTITTQRTTTARALNSQIKICLTGTPLENHLGELYSILDLAVPGCLGDVDEFRKVFVNPPSIEADDLRFLKLKSKPLILRRTKQQILSELPEKTESRVPLDFEDKQKKIYRDIAISYNHKIQEAITTQGENKCQLQMLTALLRLRQACSDPSALPGVTYTGIPPKLEALKEALVEIVESGESALVFTQFLRTLDRTETLLKSAGLPTFTIHGGLSQSAREKVLREFNDCSGGAVLVMTLKTGGVGLNLAKASYVFHLEPWWNPAVENQATDRAHRIGQRRAVQVYRYIMHESVEEKIEILKARKQLTFSAVFGDLESMDSTSKTDERIDSAGSFLSKEDFNFLLSLN